MLYLDEASSFSVVHEALQHADSVSENLTSQLVLDSFLQCWVQYFGTPKRIRCDLEGAFRGELLSSYCQSRDIELVFVPAEHHEATGDIERAVGELKKKMILCLRDQGDLSPKQAAYEMCSAHNRVARVSG